MQMGRTQRRRSRRGVDMLLGIRGALGGDAGFLLLLIFTVNLSVVAYLRS